MSASPDPDGATDRLLRRALRPPASAAPSDSCLDAEALAAWMSGGLTGKALDAATAHVADCAHCQAALAAMARMTPDAESPTQVRVRIRWWAWAAPLAATAAAVTVWVALPRAPSHVATQVPAQQAALADAKPQVELAAPQAAVTPATTPPVGAMQEARATPQAVDALKLKNIAPEEPKAAAAPPAAPSAPRPQPAAPIVAGAAAPQSMARLDARLAPREIRTIDIATPDPMIRWRVRGADVERSTDGGSTWQATPTGIAIDVTAGSAPSSSVCWLVGRSGLVLLSTDGRTWQRLAFPEPTDLSAITATDAQSAVVTAVDGRVFVTADGGATWVRRGALQEFRATPFKG